MNLCEFNAHNMWEKPVSLSSHPPEPEKWVLEVHDYTCKDLSFHETGPETIFTTFSRKALQEEVRESAEPALRCPCLVARQTRQGGLFLITREWESFPDLCDWDSKALLYPMALLNPSVRAAFQTVGELSVTAGDLVLVTTQRCWLEQWPPPRAQNSMCLAVSNYSGFGVFLAHLMSPGMHSAMCVSSLGPVDSKGKSPSGPAS